MKSRQVTVAGEENMVQFGAELGAVLPDKVLVFLEGELGAGKTTLTRGILRAFGHAGAVKSPTYTLVEPYEIRGKMLYHFDLYRVSDPEELEFVGIRDYLEEGHYCLVEWPNRGEGILPLPDLQLTIEVAGLAREIELKAFSGKGEKVLEQLSGQEAMGALGKES